MVVRGLWVAAAGFVGGVVLTAEAMIRTFSFVSTPSSPAIMDGGASRRSRVSDLEWANPWKDERQVSCKKKREKMRKKGRGSLCTPGRARRAVAPPS